MNRKLSIRLWSCMTLAFLFCFSNSAFSATLYVSSNGSGTLCTSGSPCSISYTLSTKCSAGDTIIINSGTYSDSSLNLNNASKHSNVTLTTTDAVKNALTFSQAGRGIPTGTDNRPYFSSLSSGLTIAAGVTGVTIEYLQLRQGASAKVTDDYTYIVGIFAGYTTIQYCKIWNGGAAVMFRDPSGNKAVRYCELSNAAINNSPNDTHMLYFCGNSSSCGGTGAQPPSSWTNKTLIEYCTLSGTGGGDGLQFVTASHNTETREQYVEISNCDFTLNADEQFIDTKGASYVSIHDCNFTGATGVQGVDNGWIFNTTYDSGGPNQTNSYWYIYNNIFKPSGGSPGAIFWGGLSDYWYLWNNIFYSTAKSCPSYTGTVYEIGPTPPHFTFVHNDFFNTSLTCSNLSLGGVSAQSTFGVIRNNIFYNVGNTSNNHGAITTRDGNNATVTHNFVYPTTCPSGSCTNGTSYQSEANAQVINSVGGNFHLADGVKSIRTGVALTDSGLFTPSLDKNGNPRANPPSLGAYEYGANTQVIEPANLRLVLPPSQ
jgi:hypothetical protein